LVVKEEKRNALGIPFKSIYLQVCMRYTPLNIGNKKMIYNNQIHVLINLSIYYFRYDKSTDTIGMSTVKFKSSNLNVLGKLVIPVLKTFGLLSVKEGCEKEEVLTEINNMTLINFVLKFTGPLHERTLCIILLLLQVSVNWQCISL